MLLRNAMCIQAEARGFAVALSEAHGRIVLEGFGGKVQLRISERLGEEWRTERSAWDTTPRNEKHKVPTGELRLFVGEWMSEMMIPDASEKPVETQLNAVFEKIYARIVSARERQRKDDARCRER